jgi:hypothetical protein
VTDRLYEDEELHISVEDSCEMFDQLLAMIIGATQKVLDRVKGSCDYMLIVGGLAESTYLIQKLRQAFAGSVTHKIVSPDVPSQAVLKGKLCCMLRYCELFLTCPPMLWTNVHPGFCYNAMLPCLPCSVHSLLAWTLRLHPSVIRLVHVYVHAVNEWQLIF